MAVRSTFFNPIFDPTRKRGGRRAASTPAAPSLTLTAVNGEIAVRYMDGSSSSPITARKLYRSTTASFTPSSANLIATSPALPYDDLGLTNGTTYFYSMIATNAAGDSPPAAIVSAKPAISPVPFLRTGMTNMLNNLDDAYWFTVGDSTSMGNGAGSTGTNGARALTTTEKFAEGLLGLGYKVSTDAFFGTGAVSSTPPGTEYTAYYTAAGPLTGTVTVGSSWSAGGATVGGGLWGKAAAPTGTAASPITFAPKLAHDVYDIYSLDLSNAGATIVVKIDGVQAATIVSGSGGIIKTTVSAGSLGNHTLTLDSGDATQVWIIGVVARDSSTKRLIVVNAGARGWSTNTWADASHPYRPLGAIDAIRSMGANIVGIDISLGINDIRDGAGSAASYNTYVSNMAVIAAKYSSYANIVIRTPNRISPADDIGPNCYMTDIDAANKLLAAANSFNVVDTFALVGSYATVSAAGNMYDGLHPRAAVYAQAGAAMATLVDQALTATPVPALTVTGKFENAVLNFPFSFTPAISGGSGVRTAAITAGSLPTGLALQNNPPRITGTPTAAGSFPVTLTVTDSTGSASLTVPLKVVTGIADTFSSGTSLASHAADTGDTYTLTTGTAFSIDSGNSYFSAAAAGTVNAAIGSSVAASASQFAAVDLIWLGTTTNNQNGVVVRAVDVGNFYCAGFRQVANQWFIGKVVGGTFSYLATLTAPKTPVVGSIFRARLEASDTALTLFVDGVSMLSATDTAFAAAGKSGIVAINGGAPPTATTGVHFDNLTGGAL